MHQNAVLIHPFEALLKFVVQRIIVRDGLPEIGERLVVRLRRPVRVAVNSFRFYGAGLRRLGVPPIHAFDEDSRARGKRGGERWSVTLATPILKISSRPAPRKSVLAWVFDRNSSCSILLNYNSGRAGGTDFSLWGSRVLPRRMKSIEIEVRCHH